MSKNPGVSTQNIKMGEKFKENLEYLTLTWREFSGYVMVLGAFCFANQYKAMLDPLTAGNSGGFFLFVFFLLLSVTHLYIYILIFIILSYISTLLRSISKLMSLQYYL